jgi:hypothetical protein
MTHRVTLQHDTGTEYAARMAARDARKSPQWRDVQRDGRKVTAQRVCTDCGADIDGDTELVAHWRGDHGRMVQGA